MIPVFQKSRVILFFVLTFICLCSRAQVIEGVIEDAASGEILFGAAILQKGTSNGTVVDIDGKFSLTPEGSLPVTILVSYVGFVTQEIQVVDVSQNIKIKLEADKIQLESVTVTEARITEKQKESPVTVESMDAMAVKETPAVNFYDGLGSLKGVDLTAASMGFKVVNTRGFNSTRPVRSLQLVDGVDNQAPGLNFSIGNFAGSSELDVQKVELIVGANSGLYGPNAFNGVIAMTTKDPFIHQGLAVMGKAGERNLLEMALRLAKAHKLFGSAEEVVAWKINFTYMEALDWEADNYDATEQSKVPTSNPGGYDAVNRYGDENLIPGINDYNDDFGKLRLPGLGIVHRTGYIESDLVDYNTNNTKFSPSIHFKLPWDLRAILSYNYGSGTTVYQGDNRYSLKDLQINQYIAELNKKDRFFIRAYHTAEDAGNSYDAVFTALLLQRAVKSDNHRSEDYRTHWQDNGAKKVVQLPGYPDPNNPEYTEYWFGDTQDSIQALAQWVMSENMDSLYKWHGDARKYADGVGVANATNLPRYEVGTAEFDSAFKSITSKQTYLEGGSGFYDKSSMSHIQAQVQVGEKDLRIKGFTALFGGNLREFRPRSNGTVFSDTAGRIITNSEYGIYSSLEQRILKRKVILSATGRLDKNQNFDHLFSPAASIVYLPNESASFRMSYSSAIRNPTLQDQYLYYNVGRAILIGNLEGFEDLVTVPSFFESYDSTVFNSNKLDTFSVDPVRPERVRSVEAGYKGRLGERLFIDASYYFSWYRDFLGYVIGADLEGDSSYARIKQVYRVTANSRNEVTTQGFSIGANYYLHKYYAVSGNYSWNILNKSIEDDNIIPAFNTPEHKFNLGFSGRDIPIKLGNRIYKKFGFSINYKWIQGFLFEGSPQFTGRIPTYDMVDAQVNYTMEKIHTTFKAGASNLLDKRNYQTYGGPRVGRLAYFSILFELSKI